MPVKPKIVVVGSTNTDLVVGVDHIPEPGETVLGGDLTISPGGKGANQAVAAARLGGDVTFIARVGDDAYGAASLDSFRREGIDTRFVTVTPGVPSGVALISIANGSGENAITVASGANSRLSPADIDAAASAFAEAQAIVLSLEVPLDTVRRAAERGRDRRIPVILNPAPAQPMPEELLECVSLLTPNGWEALTLTGMYNGRTPNYRNIAEVLLRLTRLPAAIITAGDLGAFVATRDMPPQRVKAVPVEAVDTVGAGDTFTAALAVELAAGRSLLDAAKFANAAAALKVTRRGAQPGIPTRAEVEEFRETIP